MWIQRSQADGGSFRAPLAANVRLTFVPVRGTTSRKLELKGSVAFPTTVSSGGWHCAQMVCY